MTTATTTRLAEIDAEMTARANLADNGPQVQGPRRARHLEVIEALRVERDQLLADLADLAAARAPSANAQRIDAQLVNTYCRGGWNGKHHVNGNAYVGGRNAWGIEYNEASQITGQVNRVTNHYRRKKDAVAVLEFITTTDWDGVGDVEGAFMRWAIHHAPVIFDSYKGEF